MKISEFQSASVIAGRVYITVLLDAIRLGEETGEVLGMIKRIERIDNPREHQFASLKDELGDVLHAVAVICNKYDLDMEDIAKKAIKKQSKRAASS